MMSASLVWPLLRAYARHAGLGPEPALRKELDRRLLLSPAWVRAGLGLSALLARWLAPLFLLGRLRRFEDLPQDEREALLERLQQDPRLPVRAAFLGLKSLVSGCCYGAPGFLERLDYRLAVPVENDA